MAEILYEDNDGNVRRVPFPPLAGHLIWLLEPTIPAEEYALQEIAQTLIHDISVPAAALLVCWGTPSVCNLQFTICTNCGDVHA